MDYHPFVVLGIGLATVLGLMLVFRVHAFLALVSAAMVVSLLAPGALDAKIRRAAEAFGSTAGSIGIVIALAAIVGKCMMDSGAADRIVRAFLGVLGEKRASTAMCASGFVLAIPVFFDTVFYLLVPLARSLWLRTRKNYVLYVTAIACGGAITHTLVPPTPGPLFMAERLGIDMGLMILVGIFIGLPMAVVGLATCRLMNRLMDIPMRPLGGQPEPEPLADDKLPSLWLSLLPVLLPVLLISINTFASMRADAERAALVRPGEVRDWSALQPAAPSPAARDVLAALTPLLPDGLRQRLIAGGGNEQDAEGIEALNRVLGDRTFYSPAAFRQVDLSPEAASVLGRGLDRVAPAEVERFNRLLIESALPGLLTPHVWETPRRQFAQMTAVLGNANLALLISAIIAMGTLMVQRGLTLRQLTAVNEEALMSAGVIILITAAGGAFGGMLREAGIKDAVEGAFGADGQLPGLSMLLIAFCVAALLKTAQGSSTVAIMTTTSMIAAMGVGSQTLGFHVVYIATTIASGSLVGSWMNDSGFWIFAKMGGLTETETLKTWTILLVVLGTTGMLASALAATLVPLV
jgi:H+/gluconate symporter-like permease